LNSDNKVEDQRDCVKNAILKDSNLDDESQAPKSSRAYKIDVFDMDEAITQLINVAGESINSECNTFLNRIREKLTETGVLGPYQYNRTNEKYLGNYRYGDREGLGLSQYPDGSIHCGTYKNDSTQGQGVLITFEEGEPYYYVGNFNENGPHEQCQKLSHKKHYSYEGAWVHGFKQGQGREVMVEMTYEGGYLKDQRDGYGKVKWANGDEYTGLWQQGEPHGDGTFHWVDGRNYVGEFKNGEFNGHGVHTWNGCKKYEGEYRDGKKAGYGVFTSDNGSRYEGNWANGKMNGSGKQYNKSNELTKDGIWKDGVYQA